jgi:virulence factor Mce-like protein
MTGRARPRRPKRRSESKAPWRLATGGLLVGLLAVGFVAFGVRSVTGVPGRSYHKLYADLPDIGNLRPHDEIRVAGVRVGQVLGEKVSHGRARVELQLAPGTGRMPLDTGVVVRARGLLGSRYLELTPGSSSQMLPDGAVIRGAPEVSLTNGVSDLLDTFDSQTRGGLGHLIDGLGQGLAGRGAGLNDLIKVGPGVSDQLTKVADSILARPAAARALVPSLDAGLTALDGARDEIARFFGSGAAGLAPFVQARVATRQSLHEAPGTLSAVQTGLPTGGRLLTATRSLAVALNKTLPGAPVALHRTTLLLRESAVPLVRTRTLLQAVRPAVPSVLKITRALSPDLVPLRRAFDDLDPIIGTLGAHGCDITNFGDNWRSVLGYGVPSKRALPGGEAGNLNQLRVQVEAGGESLGSLADPIARPFTQRRGNVYGPPCEHSPGPRYSALGIGEPGTGGSRP